MLMTCVGYFLATENSNNEGKIVATGSAWLFKENGGLTHWRYEMGWLNNSTPMNIN